MSKQIFTPSPARIKAIGIGGGGSNAITRMVREGIKGVDFIAMNTDGQALSLAEAPTRVQLGERLTRGLGAGGDHKVGAKAEEGLLSLNGKVDTLLIVPNDRLLALCDAKTPVENAFRLADDALFLGVKAISEVVTVPGLINLDFADIRSVMKDAGPAWMSMGKASGQNR